MTDDAAAGNMRQAISDALVGMFKSFYGKGPTAAKTYLVDDYVFVVMEGGLTKNEETLLAAGKADLVREYRLAFEEAMTAVVHQTIEEIVGRRVREYHSQILFNPPRSFEIIVLESE